MYTRVIDEPKKQPKARKSFTVKVVQATAILAILTEFVNELTDFLSSVSGLIQVVLEVIGQFL